ncbi:MAG: hypothetical protein NWF10_06735, partial [Candidatus Bathyarchaeota archaeon]|nr:hypothetical protein [Candidatus Bathyarchaeota archaeon]
NDAIKRIYISYERDKLFFGTGLSSKEYKDSIIELNMLKSRLAIALETANSRFKLANRGIIARVFSGIIDKVTRR